MDTVSVLQSADPIARQLGQWASEIGFASAALRIAVSLVFAAIIGCERATKRHAAGFRTFIVVSLASTSAMLLDMFLVEYHGFHMAVLSAAALVGIATLSSNSVLFSSKSQIKGLTTSVALWATAILGMLVGAGFYGASAVCFVALMCCLSLFPTIEMRLKDRSNHFEIQLELTNKANLQDFVTTTRKLGLKIDDIESNPAFLNSGLSVYSVCLTITSPELKKYRNHGEIIEALRTLEYVHFIEELT